jgi:transposase
MSYASDLTDAQWQRINYFARQTFRKHTPWHIVDAVPHVNKTGGQLRFLLTTYPHHFRRCIASGLWRRLLDAIRRAAAFAPVTSPARRFPSIDN